MYKQYNVVDNIQQAIPKVKWNVLPRPPEHPVPLLHELPVRPQRRVARQHQPRVLESLQPVLQHWAVRQDVRRVEQLLVPQPADGALLPELLLVHALLAEARHIRAPDGVLRLRDGVVPGRGDLAVIHGDRDTAKYTGHDGMYRPGTTP